MGAILHKFLALHSDSHLRDREIDKNSNKVTANAATECSIKIQQHHSKR